MYWRVNLEKVSRLPDDGKRDLPQLRALDPMPVLGDAGVVSSILNCILKLMSATPNADICSRSVLRAAEHDPRARLSAPSEPSMPTAFYHLLDLLRHPAGCHPCAHS